MAALLGVDPPDEWEGESLRSTVTDGTSPTAEPVVSVTVRGDEVTAQPIPRSLADGNLYVSVRDAEWTYIENVDDGSAELYHRPSDPTQQVDRAVDPTDDDEAVIDRFAPLVDAHAATIRTDGETATPAAVDEDLGARLEALGYK